MIATEKEWEAILAILGHSPPFSHLVSGLK